MLQKLLPLLMGIAGTGAGVAAGVVMAPAEKVEVAKPEKKEKTEEKAEYDSHDKGHGTEEASGHEYVKLTNQFVVPIVQNERVISMVVLSLSLEAVAGQQQKIYSMEPKLRDGFLRVLFDHANMGGFGGTFTDAAMLDVLRNSLRDVARRDLGDMVRNVLIVDIARQDV